MYIKSVDSVELICTAEDSAGHKQKYKITIPGIDNAFLDKLTNRIILNISPTDMRMLDICETNDTKEEKFGRED